ncbi:Inositol-1,4,5-trisphosphate 5-phosphatase 1 [Elasticomyces elasticus]|nr:Inositol-1,4,5-trisphosphate 5-phosphatase 1 [Elasticomyces elasticus]
MPMRVLLRDHPQRAIALKTETHALIFKHSPASNDSVRVGSLDSLQDVSNKSAIQRCMVEFAALDDVNLENYRQLNTLGVLGTLGLITVNHDVFLCVVNHASKVAEVRLGEIVMRINSVEFYCVNKSDYDHLLNDQINPFPVDSVDEDGFDHYASREHAVEHPCLALRKLLSGASFYYSADFDLTRRVQDRLNDSTTIALDSLDRGFLWNSHMIQPLVEFRSRLGMRERQALDATAILTSAMRGFVETVTVPASSSPARHDQAGYPSTLTLISRLSCKRAGTRFNARGIDDDGNVANFVETETVFWTPAGLCFSYVQVRGSVPVFWEQATGFTPGQQKIQVTRSPEATQHAFDKHFQELELSYGAVHVVNLLSNEKPGELELTRRYRYHVENSVMNRTEKGASSKHRLLQETDYDFHAETRGPSGYEAANWIRRLIQDSAESFAYFVSEEVEDDPKVGTNGEYIKYRRPVSVLDQEGVFRTNCLDCLDRTNLIQTKISQLAIETFLNHRGEKGPKEDFWIRHRTLWADNGDALSKTYAGTGALKSSFTRHGKMSFAGAIADVRKSATRLYINNFEDKGRQNTIDMLLGRLMGQQPVHLYDPVNDWVMAELNRRSAEYSSTKTIKILVGTFNLNGRSHGIVEDLSPWLCPPVDQSQQQPEIVAVGFQEIVELSPQQIMSTDPHRRQAWEDAVKNTLNANARKSSSEEYVLLRGGQLVGASLSVFVKASILPNIKNVEGNLKKTGMSGMAGNKGAVAIRLEYANTSICLVTAHLAAGFANYEERNQDYRIISHGLRFQRNRSIEDHDAIIWFGDFNYRIGMSNEKTRQLIEKRDLDSLYENDQLNLQMVHGKTFPFYSESRITFLPTYKYDNGTDRYDTSDKARIPAWCDRVLRKGDNLRQTHYDAAPLRFSDHRPVYATFQCTVNVVDERKREKISNELYAKRRNAVGESTAMDDSDDEDLIGYESVEPGLPPASSDRRKWWLDNGLPARSQVQTPSKDHTLNPNRPSNPFTPTSEPDWVKVDKPRPVPHRAESWQTDMYGMDQATQSRPASNPRKLPPPLSPAVSHELPKLPSRTLDSSNDNQPRTERSVSRDSTASNQTSGARQTLRKPPPPVPKKPELLKNESTQSIMTHSSNAENRRSRDVSPAGAKNIAYTSPPRKTATSQQPARPTSIASPLSAGRHATSPQPPSASSAQVPRPEVHEGPPLPPRRSTADAGLMDDEGTGLRGWEPLKPR